MIYTTYGEGGFDPSKPNNNIIDQFDDGVVWEGELKQIPASALTTLSDALADPSVNSVAEIKSALSDFVNSIE